MRVLLDGHVFLWMHASPERLPSRVRTILADAATELFVSVGTVWELGIKIAKQKLSLPEPLDEFVLTRVERSQLELLPIQLHHVVEATHLPPHHTDFFDRLLIAQARTERLTIATADRQFARYSVDLLAC